MKERGYWGEEIKIITYLFKNQSNTILKKMPDNFQNRG
jgi:hypothetical protein